ncbi:MAG: hypothetical protein JWO78_1063 [Micavibrio sp.]|nr:hypothetical protein [Micavibrio sp.]
MAEITSKKPLRRMAALAPYFLAATCFAVGGAQLWGKHREEQKKESDITEIFLNAGIPENEISHVKDVILKEHGNCALLASSLQFPCTIVKMQLLDATLGHNLKH